MSAAGPSPPILLIGMHRSGTTLLAGMLDSLGLFLGWRLAANHEASFFNKLNSWLLAASGGRWDTPAAFDHLLADAAGRELAVDYLRHRLTSPPAVEFLGPGRYSRCRSLFDLGGPWGGKDPRTTVTLYLWLELFPDARVIHLVRHGVDVADSLYRRQRSGFEIGRRRFERYRFLFRFTSKKGWFGPSPRVARRREAFRLWEEYLAFAARGTTQLGDRLLELRYESLLTDPRETMEKILAFCHLDPPPQRLAATIAEIRSDRAFGYRANPELVELWDEVKDSPWMRRHGYDTAV